MAKSNIAVKLDVEAADTGETSAIEDGKILDYITGKPVAENDKETVRQRIARALFHEYGLSVDAQSSIVALRRRGSNKNNNGLHYDDVRPTCGEQ